MLPVPVYQISGERLDDELVDPFAFGVPPLDTDTPSDDLVIQQVADWLEARKQLMHDVVLMHLANRRVGTVNTRGRSDVAGSTRKMYRQKGTGNARMGAKRTNKRVGGGVAFARRNRDYSYRIPKKAVRLSVRAALLSKFADQQAIVIQDLEVGPGEVPKTRRFAEALALIPRPDLTTEERDPVTGESKRATFDRSLGSRTILIATAEHDPILYRGVRNLPGVQIAPVAEFNTYDVLKQRYLVLTPGAFEALKSRIQEKIVRRPSFDQNEGASKETHESTATTAS